MPKAEIRRKSENRSPNPPPPSRGARPPDRAVLGFRTSDFLRISAFGLRISHRHTAAFRIVPVPRLPMRMPMPEYMRPFETMRQHQLLVVEQFGHWPVSPHPPPVQHNGPRAQLDDQFQVMRSDQFGCWYLLQQCLELAPPARV